MNIHPGTLTLTDGARTLVVRVDADEMRIEPPVPLPAPAEAPHTFTFDTVATTFPDLSWGSADPPVTMHLEARYHTPAIGALRRWARSTSRTPWRHRSIASWRWAWREAHGRMSLTIANVEIHPSWDGLEFQGSVVAQLVAR